MPGQNDLWPWLQSIMQNQGAAQPSNPAAYPAAAPQAMPGSGLNGMTAMTPGGPSMGYPALGQPAASQQPQPPQAPPPSPLGSSVTMAPSQPVGPAGADGGFNNPYQAAANAPMIPGAAPGQGGIGSDARFPVAPTPMGQGGIGSDARFPIATPAGSPSATPRPAGPLAAAGGGGAAMKRTPGAPNLGYYQQNPRFTTVQLNPNQRNAPIYTALNLAGLFGGRGQPAAAPAVNPNVPAANAQPVSASAPNAYPGDAGWDVDAQGNPIPSFGDLQNWNYGPLQRGNIWRGSGGPSGRMNR